MTTRNSCYTYFCIEGEFNPDKVSELLNLIPEATEKIGDLQHDGTKCERASWEIGRCMEYDVYIENQMRKTIAHLQDKIPLLNQIRQENNVSFVLVIVPTIYADEITPCLDPPLDVIDFCHATRTNIVIDMYVCESGDK